MSSRRLLIASCVRQEPAVLGLFFNGFGRLIIPDGWRADWLIQANGNSPAAQAMIASWAMARGAVFWERANDEPYDRDGAQHEWSLSQIERIAAFKDEVLDYAVANAYDAVFLVDSDLVLDTRTLQYLAAPELPIVSEIFWTQWQLEADQLPNVWLQDQYSLVMSEAFLDDEARTAARMRLLNQLRIPGLYQVGGLGACTWLTRAPLQAGVRFRPITNLSLIGEDRHFCVRADVLGFPLHVDTHVPAFHIYRDSDLPQAQRIVAGWARP